jgi:ABC-type Fe3+/spermidine/putrescine transport system ATPase subunit
VTTAPRIEVTRLQVCYGETVAVHEIDFSVAAGELVTLLGPSGCGKTTTLRSIAGLETPSSGRILLHGEPMYCSATRRNVPTEKRGVSMVFQSYAIWPHMTVFENVAYGLRVRRLPATELRQHVDRALDLVQMRNFADRPASKLSGGQQQRVAVARAVAFNPKVLLFDEPLSNLDAKLRAEMRVELRELQRRLGITSLYVTHDQEEALAISDRIIVMQDGRIEQIGTPEEIYGRPSSRFVADFVGCANLIPGSLKTGYGGRRTFERRGGLSVPIPAQTTPRDDATVLALRPTYVTLSNGGMEKMAGAIVGSIHRRMFHGDYIQYIVD